MDKIQERVQAHYDYLESLGYNIVGIFAQGSMNYNLFEISDEYQSDVDTKAIVLPTLDDLVKGNKLVSTKYDFGGEQIDVKDIRMMMEVWRKQNQSYLEILFTKYKVINPKYQTFIDQILDMRDEITKMNIPQLARCIRGMAAEKVEALEHPYPATEDKIQDHGFDEKQIASTARLAYLMDNLFHKGMSFGDAIYFDKESDRHFMMSLKKCKDVFGNKIDLFNARILEKMYDEYCAKVKQEVVSKYGKDDFKNDILKKLEDIVYACIKYSIVSMVKED